MLIVFQGYAAQDSHGLLPMDGLINRLQAEKDIDSRLIHKYLVVNPVVLDHAIIAKNLKQVEKKASYDYFLTDKPLQLARNFLDQNHDWLTKMETGSPVPKELVVAIFLLESHFGRYDGRYPLLQVFASLSLCDQEPVLQQTYDLLCQSYPQLDYQWLVKRATRKSSWAYGQLKALLQMGEKVDVAELKGSWAGAFGIPQFIPASLLSYGVDGNGDGRIDLYDYHDAAASVVNYLERHGWQPHMTADQEEKIIWSYNHSALYVKTILAIRNHLIQQ
ncbi:MAG: lytic murein transglycosylase [Deltaproteobacteria bacterium]|nr:lytic murein transglycosylase [Candidatus Anaeroferrophillus wilburensis]MBN2889772.1 lytic murein transglycosylase [Deltaproteobacteria bacterium]